MKKVIICGVGKIQNDFQYIFTQYEPEWYIWTENSYKYREDMEIYPYDHLEKEDMNNIEVIICDKDKEQCKENLERHGLVYGKHFFYAEDYFHTLDFPLQDIVAGRKIAIWGTGEAKEKLLCQMKKMDSGLEKEILFYIDNNEDKKNTFIDGIKVVDVASVDLEKVFVIVASGCYKEIRCQLIDRGLRENTDFCDYQKICISASEMIKKTIYDTPLKDNHCMWPFERVNIQVDNVYACGWPSWLTTPIGSEFSDNLDDVWNSDVARVIRLSMLNHTYSFCERETCPYLELNPVYDENYVFDRFVGYGRTTPDKPKHVAISFDEVCNLKCLSCRKQGLYHNSDNLKRTLQEVTDKIVDSEWINQAEHFEIAGNGEVFYSEWYKELLFNTKIQGNNILIQTNGTLIQQEYLDQLIERYKYIEFYVSIDAASDETFRKLRTGSWKALTKGLDLLSEYRKKNFINRVRLSFVVQRDNYTEMIDFIKMAKHYGFDWIYFSRIQNFCGWEEEEFWKRSMINKDGTMKEALIEVFRNPLINDDIVDVRQFYRNLDVSGVGELITNRHETVFWGDKGE